MMAPRPGDHDWSDELGLSDSFVGPEDLAEELEHLERDELLLTGRTLRIVWQSGAQADAIRRRFFSDSRFGPENAA